MTRSSLLLVLGLTLMPMLAWADAEGLPCVVDGNTIAIGGHRSLGRCNGGVMVRLFGIDAPDLAQTCLDPQNREWRCGLAAAANLLELIKRRNVVCKGNSQDAQGRLVATCQVGALDVNRELVRQGWATASSRESTMYSLVEGEARNAGRGIWQSRFDAPAEWRRQHAK
ncbi:MAG: thermonuclease family protein [Alphaproteobacteria bacterium]|nr:thermonuclease family protein [Alphaproteobacteria bacterium]